MNNVTRPSERLNDLLADEALDGLSPQEQLELQSLLAARGAGVDLSMQSAAAALELALMQPADFAPMPADAQERVQRMGEEWAASSAPVLRLTLEDNASGPSTVRRASHVVWTTGPWLAAAACLLIAAIAWWPSSSPDLVSMVNAQPVKMAAEWTDWDKPEIPGVRGKVVWCDKIQKGYMQFAGLPRNDPTQHQYQVWIIDDRGMEQRISGGVFNVEEEGEVLVPITAPIEVRNAKAFAVTIEKPGGTWVSDMSRRVAIASK